MKTILFFTLTLEIVLSSIAQAVELPDYCKDGHVRSIQVPISYSDLKLGNFSFRYQLIEGNANRSNPVVIYLPGGPGGDPGNFIDVDQGYSMIFWVNQRFLSKL